MVDENGIRKYSFFEFPNWVTQRERRRKWAEACGRKEKGGDGIWYPEDKKGVYICSEHFITGWLLTQLLLIRISVSGFTFIQVDQPALMIQSILTGFRQSFRPDKRQLLLQDPR